MYQMSSGHVFTNPTGSIITVGNTAGGIQGAAVMPVHPQVAVAAHAAQQHAAQHNQHQVHLSFSYLPVQASLGWSACL